MMQTIRCFAACAGLIVATVAGHAGAGVLVDPVDPAFGVVGAVVGNDGSSFVQLAPAPGGRLLVLAIRQITSTYSPCYGPFVMAFTPGGSRDASFGKDGVLDGSTVGVGCVGGQVTGFAVDSANRIVLTYYEFPTQQQFVIRIDAQGHRDMTFGAGGVVVLPGVNYLRFPVVRAVSGGATVIFGEALNLPLTDRVAAYRLTQTGALDTTFGSGGSVMLSDVDVELGNGHALAVDTDGALVAAWSQVHHPTVDTLRSTALVARLLASGAPDPAFGVDGRATGIGSENLDVESLTLASGRVIVAVLRYADDPQRYRLYGIDAAGKLDASFGVDGVAEVSGDEDTARAFLRLATDSGQRILGIILERNGHRVLRWRANGEVDGTFGASGSALVGVVSDGVITYGPAPAIASTDKGVYAAFLDPRMPVPPYAHGAAALTRLKADGGHVAGIERAVAVNYFNETLDHFFVTANAEEQRLLDIGYFRGWKRTGDHWTVVAPGSGASALTPVCRFYGRPEAGLDSHFYSASPAECADVERKFPTSWAKESDNVFEVYLPDPTTGACPADALPIYRYFNGRSDANHLFFTIGLTILPAGWVVEGYGPPPLPVAMCAPIL